MTYDKDMSTYNIDKIKFIRVVYVNMCGFRCVLYESTISSRAMCRRADLQRGVLISTREAPQRECRDGAWVV